MRAAYTLKASDRYVSNPQAEGTWDREVPGEWGLDTERALPEFGDKRVFDRHSDTLVLPIGDRRFKVTVQMDCDDDGGPKPGSVVFEETEEPETPYKVWDPKATLEAQIERDRQDLKDVQGDLHIQGMIQRVLAQKEQDLESGEWRCYRPHDVTSAFGQPSFIQGKSYPVYEGRCASHLLTFETGWGDCGNENYMVALDGDGYPVAVFHEASCH